MIERFRKIIRLIGSTKSLEDNSWMPDDYPVAGAMGCFAEESSADIHRRYSVINEKYRGKDWDSTKELIMRETSGRGHGAVLDQVSFIFSIDNLSRASTLFLCGPEYASHLQQSLRRANAERGFVSIEDVKGDSLMEKQFSLYNEMVNKGVPTEDARIVLPLNTKTTIQSKWDARELIHLKSMVERMQVPAEVYDTVHQMYNLAYKVAPKTMVNREKNYEVLSWFPSSQLFARKNTTLERIASTGEGIKLSSFSKGLEITGEEISRAVIERDEALLANLKHYHFTFIVPMSLMTFHQATRQRTWNQSVEPLVSAAKRGIYITPKSIYSNGFEERYKEIIHESLDYVNSFSGNAEVQGIIPHGLEIYDVIHINGWNAIHSIGKRTCKTAQWEIRAIAEHMAQEIRKVTPELGEYCKPQGIIYGTCPEKENCGACYNKKRIEE